MELRQFDVSVNLIVQNEDRSWYMRQSFEGRTADEAVSAVQAQLHNFSGTMLGKHSRQVWTYAAQDAGWRILPITS